MSGINKDYMQVIISEVIDHPEASSKSFVFSRPDGKILPAFRAGQYISLRLKIGESLLTRPYSLSSAPDCGRYTVTIQSNPEGFAADWMLENLKAGDSIEISHPQGEFFHNPEKDGINIIAVSGGSGITPFLSMACAIRDKAEDFNLTILYGNRTSDSILFKKELDSICAATPKVKVVHVLSDEKAAGCETGFITAELIKKYSKEDSCVYVCGPEDMYRFLEKELPKLGLPKERIRSETPGVTRKVSSHDGFPKEAAGRKFSIKLKKGRAVYNIKASSEEPVLVAIERAGISAPSMCRSGVCGWCKSRLVSGKCFIPGENDVRDREEVRNNEIRLCASFPVSDLVLELN